MASGAAHPPGPAGGEGGKRYAPRLAALRERYAQARPASAALAAAARAHLPGGNTRSVLHVDPFPTVMERGRGDRLWDVDGHVYVDCAGEFSAGLYGHDDPHILSAVGEALADGLVLGAPTRREARLAELIAARFPAMERLRFCNSGTEANLMALATARAVTGREGIVVFDGAYHGGPMTFPAGGANPLNVPYRWMVLPYNDADAFTAAMERAGKGVAAVIVEPVLGAAGNIPARADFLAALRERTAAAGTLLVFDEVKTSRLGPGGAQGLFGIRPDLTTLGKYLGGGLHFGAFGGRADVMDRFDPARPDALKHAGTFNNAPVSLAAGIAGLTRVFTAERAAAFLGTSAAFLADLARGIGARGLPVSVSGLGSMMSLHVGQAPERASDVVPATLRLRTLVHLAALERGLYLTPRGDLFLSLPMDGDTLARIRDVLIDCIDEELPFLD